ncbi:Poly(A) polymerase [Trichodelitschia bisporula]|uniref:Poly(A) polymerase n=1 Tax=Trichodelitschia bisporula TaxID=703511 RepID=A0A6G1HKD4_9PEZI|nr:Poly(A) polymerase [Trichodelitschia bisporula]
MAGSTENKHQWGVTGPISMSLPSEDELRLNEALINELKAQDNFESLEDTERRKQVLQLFQKVTEEFVRVVGKLKGLSQSAIDNAGGKVSTYGSYRLGVYGPGSDIDTLIVGPKHVTRSDFFEHFIATLRRMSPPDAIEEATPVSDAHVPIIKLEFSGISIDLIFVRLLVSSVPENLDLKDKTLLRGLDEVDLRSINGTRVTDEIMSLVPQVKSFRHALRAIKLWAQRRAIYSNVIGFPGGVAWAMMVARICQLYPMAPGAVIVAKFFHIMGGWPWPRPILLKNIEDGPLPVRAWNPQLYAPDRRHLMPIITPAYPSMCATHNITTSTKKVILRELARANTIAQAIHAGKKPWKELFQKHSFFSSDYKYYLSIIAASRTKEAQQTWSGLVQSKVRRLVSGIEFSDTGVAIAHPFNKGFDRVHLCKREEDVDMILQGDLQFQVQPGQEVKGEVKDATGESKASNGANGDDNGDKNNTTENKSGEDNSEAKGGDSKDDEPQDVAHDDAKKDITIYTTTFYIGLELAENDGMFPVTH